jgi:hypothetical protein
LIVLNCGPAEATVRADYGKIRLAFEPNRGQAESQTSYLARGNGFLLSIEPDGSRLTMADRGKSAEIRCRLLGSNRASRLEALDPLPGHSSYFRGRDVSKWITGIPNFAKVRAAGVYAGIDLVYYGNQSALEYDFVLAPGADPRAIRLRFDGVRSMRIDGEGNLVLSTAAGEFTERRPVVYQTTGSERRPVAGRFVLVGRRTVSFQLAAYDRSRPVVIDPVLIYASFLGGADLDEGHAVAADAGGNLYLTGRTLSTPAGDSDVLVRKISPDGSTFLYNADLGGSDNDIGNAIAVFSDGSAYVGGRTRSGDFPVFNAFQNANLGVNNAFVLRLDPSGSNLIFSTYVGGSTDDRGYALALDTQGSVYLAGGASSTDFPTSPGAFQRLNRGGLDCFVVKFDSSGNGIWGTLVGGGSDDQAFGIAVDANGNSYITGQTNSDSYPQVNPPFQHSRHGGLDAFVTEITADGSGLVYSTFAGGGNDDTGNAIAVDPNGNAYVAGTTASGDFPTTNGAFQTGYAGGSSDAFVLAYTANGQFLMFSTLVGSHGTDEGNGIALDGANDVFLIGDTNSDQYPVTANAIQPNRAGGFDVVFSVLDSRGSQLLYSTFFGGSGDDFGLAVAADADANAYFTGATSSNDFPVTNGAAQTQPGGGVSDAFFALIAPGGSGLARSSMSSVTNAVNPESMFRHGMPANPIPGRFTRGEAGAAKSSQRHLGEARFGRPRWRQRGQGGSRSSGRVRP